jgi:hypothetical protein
MSDHEEDKVKSPFDSELDDDTIALSTDELDNILTDAEALQNTVSADEGPGSEEASISEELEVAGNETESLEDDFGIGSEPSSDSLEEGEFDISGEIDELSPEDLENIEIEDSDVDAYTMELESELGADKDSAADEGAEPVAGGIEESLDDDFADIDTEGITLEANIDEEMDLDTYLDSVKSDIDFESTGLDESADIEDSDGTKEETPLESPVLGDTEEIINIEVEAEEAFKEAGIEGIADELDTAGIDIDEGSFESVPAEDSVGQSPEEDESVVIGEETLSVETEADDFQLDINDDLEITEEPVEDGMIEDQESQGEGDILEEESFIAGDDIEITEEEIEAESLEFSEEGPVSAETEIIEGETAGTSVLEPASGEEEPSLDIDETELQIEEDLGMGESFEDEVTLTEEEESILNADIELEDSAEDFISEEVVSVTGEELNIMTGEESSGFEESADITGEAETEPAGADAGPFDMEPGSVDDEATMDGTLYNAISVLLQYMDNLLGDLPEEKIKEFSQSKYFSLYKEVFEKLNLT